eukprot:gene20202-26223_t
MDRSELLSEDGLDDEFEYSADDTKLKNPRSQKVYDNKPYDEEYELSQDLSVAESFDARDKKYPAISGSKGLDSNKIKTLQNNRYDEEYEVSQSIAETQDKKYSTQSESKGNGPSGNTNFVSSSPSSSNKTKAVKNDRFDEVMEMSQSGSEESVDTIDLESKRQQILQQKDQLNVANKPNDRKPASNNEGNKNYSGQALTAMAKTTTTNPQTQNRTSPKNKKPTQNSPKIEESDEGEHDESYENVEGAYNPKDYLSLDVATEVRDLFLYIERFKPHEVELETTLKCFIPDYIPSIGEIDGFVKIPRPDGKDDELGFKVLDEPSAVQSDPTVLELQLRAKSKKLQYSEVAVRSIENAAKNPAAIDKWIQNVSDLHRSKPPPQVNYKKNMPDSEKLMEAWPEEFEQILKQIPLPSPELDMSLLEYVKVLCGILDIPVYDNPIESLHLMFSLFMDFRNNPHFQTRFNNNNIDIRADGKSTYDGADILDLNSK